MAPEPTGPITHRLVLTPTQDVRASSVAGKGVTLRGNTDRVIVTDDNLAGPLHDVLEAQLGAEGIVLESNDAEAPHLSVELVALTLQRDPGVVAAHYTGTAELRMSLHLASNPSAAHTATLVGHAERQAAGIRVLEQAVFDELLTATLLDAARRVARHVGEVIRDAPPQPLQ